jgi:phosphopantetheinyl transferase
MPLIYNHSINNYTKIGVWHITEAEDFFFEKFSLQQTITHPHKRLQHLAGRHLLSILFPSFPTVLIKIASTKKPFLEDEAFHFSISHCGDYAAAIVSTNNRVGVDIETPHPKIERIQHKFITPQEQVVLQNFSSNMPQMLTMAWSIKEAIFKWYGLGQVDFKKHLQINSFQHIENEIVADCTFSKQERIELKVKNISIQGNNLSWVVS